MPSIAATLCMQEKAKDMSEHFDVIVIGAGPGGEVAADRLHRAGMRVAVHYHRAFDDSAWMKRIDVREPVKSWLLPKLPLNKPIITREPSCVS